ncbi:RHS repeat-associated core domain-containing protein [Streptomyces sp. Tue6028]|uniref:RHS repeat-associated core domain-containing protein n=1 Tax=Streptomyces sp. Tue6028 TaxID=2036037 RepID=UPI003D721F1C
MAGNRPGDWHVLDLEKDPTPGDPDRVRHLAKNLLDFADDVGEALRSVKGMADEDAVLKWAGKSAKAFGDEFSGVPKQLKKLKKSYEMAGDALAVYWPVLERAQALADKALAKGREAQSDLSSAKSRLSSADSWVTRANKEADKYKDDPAGSKDKEKPDEGKVRAATRDAQHAQSAQTSARSDVTSASGALDAAKKMAEDARKMREEAARTAKTKIDEASDAGIHNRKWWEEVGDWFSDNWDTIVAVCKVVVAVVGIIAMIIGGPILGAIVLIAALVVLADTLNKYRKGQASLWDVAFAALDCIPGGKGITTLGGLAKGLKAFGKTGLKGMALGLKGLAKGARSGARQMKTLFTRGDPIDVATGQMVMSARDVLLPGILPLAVERHHRTGGRSGRWFGPSWISTLDQRLLLDADGVRFVADDGMVLIYPVPEPGLDVLPVEGPRWPLEWTDGPDGRMTVRQPQTGRSLHFRAQPGSTGAELLLDAVTDRHDNTLRISYTPDGAPETITHHGGYRVGVTAEAGRVTAMNLLSAPGQPVLVRYAYDERGNLSEVHDSSGLPLRFSYDDRRRVTRWEDRNGTWYGYTYDRQGRCVHAGGTDGILDYAYAYDENARTTTVRNSLGHSTLYTFSDTLQLLTETDPLGHTTTRTWDRYDRLRTITDPLGRTTRYRYDEHGRNTEVEYPEGTTATLAHDGLGLPVHATDPDGAQAFHTYGERGDLVATADAGGAVTRHRYDDHGGLVETVDALGGVRRVERDGAGLPRRVTDTAGAVSSCVRDVFGRIVESTDPVGGVSRFGWTPEGRLAWRTKPSGATEHWRYDGEGNVLEHRDAAGGSTRWTYGPFDLVRTRTTPDGSVLTFAYDSELRLLSVANAGGAVWSYGYDPVGNTVTEEDFNGRRITYRHDAARQLVERSEGPDHTVDYERDTAGNVVTRRSADETAVFSYTPAGRMIRVANAHAEVEFAYDAAGQLIAETCNGRTVSSSYDELGRRTRRTTPEGVVSRWEYDPGHRPAALHIGPQSLRFAYDAAGRETGRDLGASRVLSQSWDEDFRLTEQTLVDAADRRVQERRRYTYRPDGIPTGVDAWADGARRYALDPVGRVTGVDAAGWTERYAYDAAGNMSEATAGNPGEDAVAAGTRLRRSGRISYTYDAYGRVVRRTVRLLSGGSRTWSYTWDTLGRLLTVGTPEGTTWRYAYDPLGRRISKRLVDDSGRTRSETVFVWDRDSLAEQTHRAAPDSARHVTTWEFSPAPVPRPLAQVDRIEPAGLSQDEVDVRFRAIVTDLAGAPSELVDAQGRVTWRRRATVWGAGQPTAGDDIDCPVRFPGQYNDPETGLDYNRHRYYDSATGRYLTPDPLGLDPAPNDYAYTDNPLVWSDPLGLAPCGPAIINHYRGASQRVPGGQLGPAVSVRQLRMALGRRGMSVEHYDIVHVPQIDGPLGPAFGNSPHTAAGFPMLGPRGRPVIEISDLGLRSMDEAVSTVFHETMHHHQQAARRGMQDAHNDRAYITTPGDEEMAELYGQQMLERFRARGG